jgi:hypothetical protein
MRATSGWRDGDRSRAVVPLGDVARARDVARVVALRARVRGTGARVVVGEAVLEARREEAAGVRRRLAVGGAAALGRGDDLAAGDDDLGCVHGSLTVIMIASGRHRSHAGLVFPVDGCHRRSRLAASPCAAGDFLCMSARWPAPLQ